MLKGLDCPSLFLIFASQSNNFTMKTLVVSTETFSKMLSDIIASGVTFEAKELPNGREIAIEFTGGY